jgi:hypothetical protein
VNTGCELLAVSMSIFRSFDCWFKKTLNKSDTDFHLEILWQKIQDGTKKAPGNPGAFFWYVIGLVIM